MNPQLPGTARRWRCRAAAMVAAATLVAGAALGAQTATPIEHLIVIVGENHSFDTLFATYVSPSGASVRNLLSQGIVNTDGTPGPQFARAVQRRAQPAAHYRLNPPRAAAFAYLPQPVLTGVLDPLLRYLKPGADRRFPQQLAPGPFPVTHHVPYAALSYPATLAGTTAALANSTGDPVHRFFQMWQQTGGDNATPDLYAWVAVTTGIGGDNDGISPQDPQQGGELMGFVDMHGGDAAYLRSLADRYAISDNYHQSIMGGTGANFYALSTGDVALYTRDGALARPPENQIENPDPLPGTENFYRRDGFMGGSYVNCADAAQPGVGAILQLLAARALPAAACRAPTIWSTTWPPASTWTATCSRSGPTTSSIRRRTCRRSPKP